MGKTAIVFYLPKRSRSSQAPLPKVTEWTPKTVYVFTSEGCLRVSFLSCRVTCNDIVCWLQWYRILLSCPCPCYRKDHGPLLFSPMGTKLENAPPATPFWGITSCLLQPGQIQKYEGGDGCCNTTCADTFKDPLIDSLEAVPTSKSTSRCPFPKGKIKIRLKRPINKDSILIHLQWDIDKMDWPLNLNSRINLKPTAGHRKRKLGRGQRKSLMRALEQLSIILQQKTFSCVGVAPCALCEGTIKGLAANAQYLFELEDISQFIDDPYVGLKVLTVVSEEFEDICAPTVAVSAPKALREVDPFYRPT